MAILRLRLGTGCPLCPQGFYFMIENVYRLKGMKYGAFTQVYFLYIFVGRWNNVRCNERSHGIAMLSPQ
jgi:hypothetical protein